MDVDAILLAARDLVEQHPFCFAITVADETANARIIQVGSLEPDWSIKFMTEKHCRKYREMARSMRLTLAFQDDDERAYVTLIGTVSFIEDAEFKRGIWKPESFRFHPGGPHDPNVVVVHFQTVRIEVYSGANDIRPEPVGLRAAALDKTYSGWIYTTT